MEWQLFLKIILESWDILADSSIFILSGLFLSGILYVFFKRENIIKYIGTGKISSIFWASLIGMPLPLCSCAIIPTAIKLNKQGADKGAVSSFLISAQETSIDSIIFSYVLLDPMLTIFRPISALIAGVTCGIMEILFGKKSSLKQTNKSNKSVVCNNRASMHKLTLAEKFKEAMAYGFVKLIGDIALWLFIGIVLASIISILVSPELIQKYLNNDFKAMLIMLAIGIFVYIYPSTSTPISASLIFKGLNPGAALVFLLTGPATNATSIVLLLKNFGKRSVIIYLFSISLTALVIGTVIDFLYNYFNIDAQASVGHIRELFPMPIKWIFAFILVFIMINAVYRRGKNKGFESHDK